MKSKKDVILLVIFVFALSNSHVVAQQYLKDTLDLKGAVKSVTYESFQFSDGEKVSWEENYYTYNRHGYLISQTSANSRYGEIYMSFQRDFDSTGTRCLRHYTFRDKDTVELRSYAFDNTTKPEMMSLYRRSKHYSNYHYIYNEQGLLADEIIVYQRKLDTCHNYFYYDAAGRKIINKDFDGRTKMLRVWTYNEDGRLIEKKLLDSNWAKIHYYERDKDGNPVEVKVVDHSNNPATGRSSITRYTYNKNGQELTDKRMDMNGNVKSSFKYWYNEQGDKSKLKGFYINPNGKREKVKFSFSHVYDLNGNWVESTRMSGREIVGKSIRNIVYYTD